MNKLTGKAWVFGDDINTDLLAPGRFMHRPIKELAQNCLIDLSPDFAKYANPNDVIIGGRNFGVGSSREQAAQALKMRGIQAVIAKSFAGIFYRNAINLGLPVLEGNALNVAGYSTVSLDMRGGILTHSKGEVVLQKIPEFLLKIIDDDGLIPHLEKKLALRGKA